MLRKSLANASWAPTSGTLLLKITAGWLAAKPFFGANAEKTTLLPDCKRREWPKSDQLPE